MYKTLRKTEGKKNEYQIHLIKKVLNRVKEAIKNVSEDRKSMTEEQKKIINIVERIFYFNQLEKQGLGLKILKKKKLTKQLYKSLIDII